MRLSADPLGTETRNSARSATHARKIVNEATMISVPATLDDILATASALRVTRVSLEYDSGGDLEVMYMLGSDGVGVAVRNRDTQSRIIAELVDRAGLKSRSRGTLRAEYQGREHAIRVTERDHFGECAFDLHFSAK